MLHHWGRCLLWAMLAAFCLSGAAAAQAIPTVSLVGGPPAWTSQASATFQIATSEPVAVECRLDVHRDAAAHWEQCMDGHTVAGPLAEGRHVLEVRPGSSGPPQDSWTWRVDVTSPAAPTIFEPEGLWHLVRQVTVSWGTSDVPSGVGTYNLRYKRWTAAGANSRVAWLRRTTVTGATFVADTGRTYCLEAIARDRAGNLAPSWSDPSCFAVPVGSRSLEHDDGWRRTTGAVGSFLGSYLQTRAKGAWARREVVARRLVLVVTRCPECGAVAISWRGRVIRTINLGAATTRRGQIVPITSFAERRRGTLRVEVTSSGRPVRIEGLGVSAV